MIPAEIFGGVFQIGRSEKEEKIGLVDSEISKSNTMNKIPIHMPRVNNFVIIIVYRKDLHFKKRAFYYE